MKATFLMQIVFPKKISPTKNKATVKILMINRWINVNQKVCNATAIPATPPVRYIVRQNKNCNSNR